MLPLWLQNYDLLIFDQIDSTNDEAIRLVKAGVKENLIVLAREQSKGKGQRGKSWVSVSGNLYASIVVQPKIVLTRSRELSFLTAVVLHDTIIELMGGHEAAAWAKVQLKWPNDLLISGKKIAGILLESIQARGKDYVIIGIGVNTHFMPGVEQVPITSLLNEGIILKHPDDFLSAFMEKFHAYYTSWQKDNSFERIRKKWLQNAYKLDERVTVQDGGRKIPGIFRGIDKEGAPSIELAGGELRSFPLGKLDFSQ